MLLLSFLLHLLIQPAYAQEATPSATPIVASITIAPTIAITPTLQPTEIPTPTDMPVVTSVTLTTTPSPTPTEQQAKTTPTPTQPPVFSLQQATTPTPMPKRTQGVAMQHGISLPAQVIQTIAFPEDFFSYMKRGEYYQSTQLPKEETRNLLTISAICSVLGLILINWETLTALTYRLFKRKHLAYVLNENSIENGQEM